MAISRQCKLTEILTRLQSIMNSWKTKGWFTLGASISCQTIGSLSLFLKVFVGQIWFILSPSRCYLWLGACSTSSKRLWQLVEICCKSRCSHIMVKQQAAEKLRWILISLMIHSFKKGPITKFLTIIGTWLENNNLKTNLTMASLSV